MIETLQRELEQQIEGEVRFDRVSRALYSTDASVYQIEPLGVVVVRSRQDVVRTVEIARRHGSSITARGGGTSQAGQAIGPGLQLDTSKYFNRVLEVNVGERWARVEPGVVLDELNAELRPHGLRFAPDISTASRATIGGMMANNSSGARSVYYGKTIDHVLEQEVVLADGRVAHFRPLGKADLDAACQGEGLEASCYRIVRQLARDCAQEIDRRFPKILRRVGGYNLDEFVDASKPFNLCKIMVGSEGTLGLVVAAKIKLVPLPKAKAVLTIEFDNLLTGVVTDTSDAGTYFRNTYVRACLRYRGRAITVGSAGRDFTPFDAGVLGMNNQSLTGVFLGAEIVNERTRTMIGGLVDEVAAGSLQVLVDRTYPLADAAAAHAYIESRKAVGRVVLIP